MYYDGSQYNLPTARARRRCPQPTNSGGISGLQKAHYMSYKPD